MVFNGFPTFQLTYETPWAPIRPVFKRKVAFGDDVSNPNALYELDNGLVELTYLPADTELLNLPDGNTNPRFDLYLEVANVATNTSISNVAFTAANNNLKILTLPSLPKVFICKSLS